MSFHLCAILPLVNTNVLIDVGEIAESYASPIEATTHNDEPSKDTIAELWRAHEAFEREMEISRRVTATELEEINVGTIEDPRTISITKNLLPTTRSKMITLLLEYKDVLAWPHEDMNVVTITDAFPLSFTNSVLDVVEATKCTVSWTDSADITRSVCILMIRKKQRS